MESPGVASASSRQAISPSRSPPPPTAPLQNYRIPAVSFEANTGPKGVIADAQSFDRARKRSFRKTLNGISNAVSSNVAGFAGRLSNGTRPLSRSREGSDVSEDDDDKFLESWRARRLLELEGKNGRAVQTRRTSPSKRNWMRCLTTVDALGYLDAIEHTLRDTIVVVLIADDKSSVSRLVEESIADLAQSYEFTRFIKLPYEEAEMDPTAVPTILAYKNGDLTANLVSIIDEIPPDLSLNTSSLESVLHKHDVL